MIVTPSEFGMTPRAIQNTLELLSISYREVRNIANMIECELPECFYAVDRSTFAGMKNALLVYEVFLQGHGFPFARNDKIDSAFTTLYQAWSSLVQMICKRIPNKSESKRFSTAWTAATDELQAILERRKFKSAESEHLYANFILALDETAEALSKLKRNKRLVKMRKARRSSGELSQEDVAKVFGVTRQTVNRWETKQTLDSPDNKSNPWGYYKSLRINPELRNAFEMLSNQAKAYLSTKEEAKKRGVRFRMTFVKFKEDWHKHNNAKI